jgi:hypothetical protein
LVIAAALVLAIVLAALFLGGGVEDPSQVLPP